MGSHVLLEVTTLPEGFMAHLTAELPLTLSRLYLREDFPGSLCGDNRLFLPLVTPLVSLFFFLYSLPANIVVMVITLVCTLIRTPQKLGQLLTGNAGQV